jgi:hypothetical protein
MADRQNFSTGRMSRADASGRTNSTASRLYTRPSCLLERQRKAFRNEAGHHAFGGAISYDPHDWFINRRARRSMRFRLLPTFLTAFFTAALGRQVFFASYLTS